MSPGSDFPNSLSDAIEALLEAQHNRSTGEQGHAVEVAHAKLVEEIRAFAEQCASDAVDGVVHEP